MALIGNYAIYYIYLISMRILRIYANVWGVQRLTIRGNGLRVYKFNYNSYAQIKGLKYPR